MRKTFGQKVIRLIHKKTAVFVKGDYFRRIDKFKSKIVCHNNTVQVFTAGSGVLSSCFLTEVLSDNFKLFIQRKVQPEAIDDSLITLLNFFQLFGKVFLTHRSTVTFIKHISDLHIFRETFTRCRRDHVSSGFILMNNLTDFLELCGISQ